MNLSGLYRVSTIIRWHALPKYPSHHMVHWLQYSSSVSDDGSINIRPSLTAKHRITAPVGDLKKYPHNEQQGSKMHRKKHQQGDQRQKDTIKKPRIKGQIIYGKFPVLTALQAQKRKIHKLYVKSNILEEDHHRLDEVITSVIQIAHNNGIPLEGVPKEFLNMLVDDPTQGLRQHQGLCADVSPIHYLPLDLEKERAVLEINTDLPKVWLVIQSVQDPNNFGALLRSAYYLGIDRIIGYNSCKLSPAVSKVSAGVIEVLDIYKTENLLPLLEMCHSYNWQIFGTAGISPGNHDVINLREVRVEHNTLVILGNEGYGLAKEITSLCDKMITIPSMNKQQTQLAHGLLDSLNVSVASGIIVYHLMNSRVKS